MPFSRQIKFIEDFELLIYSQLRDAINGSGFELEEAIREDQLFNRGVDGDNQKLKDSKTGRLGYTRTTIRIKIAKGQPVDRITLRDENDFHPSIQIKAFFDRFEVSSNVTHAKFLISRYGLNILKPTGENMSKFIQKNVLPNLKTNIDGQFQSQ